MWTTLKSVKDKDITYLTYDIGTKTNYTNIWRVPSHSRLIRGLNYSEWTIETSENYYLTLLTTLNTSIAIEFEVWVNNEGTFFDIMKNSSRVCQGKLSHTYSSLSTWTRIKIILKNNTITSMDLNNSRSKILAQNCEWDTFRFVNFTNVTQILQFKNFKVYQI